MVLVSNEWQNKCEDEQKSSASVVVAPSTATGTLSVSSGTNTGATTSSTTTAVAITSTISPATATIVNADLSTTSIATATDETIASANNSRNVKISPPTIAPIKTTEITSIINAIPLRKGTAVAAANDNNNDEGDFEEDKQRHKKTDKIATDFLCTNNRQQQQNDNKEIKEITEANCNLKEEDLIASVLNYSNIEIMAENAKETQLKETDADEVIIDNTIIEKSIIDSSHNNLEIDNTIKDGNKSNAPLLPSVTVKTQNIQNAETTQQQHIPPPPPPENRQEFIKSRLRTVIASMRTNTSSAATGLEPNFLSRLELREDGVMQPMFKPLSTFSAAGTAVDATHNKTDGGNNALTDINDAPLDPTSTVVPSGESNNNGQAKILLICEGNSHPFQTRSIFLTSNVECMVGRLIAKSKAAENNAIFDCKVLSRKHAVIWYTPDGKFWVKDTKSSNGTFINDIKIGDGDAELHFGDIVKFGVDVVENSRKEVHGCIIACVQLYLPDGREAISIDSPAHRSLYSSEGRISYEDLHRLNLYIQETSQREKVLASKLCSIQNILEATRKNSSMCWQSMISEDQLLHRIHTLEKKLSFMEKNVPDNVLRNEVKNLLDDKTFYQQTAKEALRKVYQERCDAMQMLAKMESAFAQSDNECSLLRDQIMNCKQTLQEVNSRLIQLETEYNDYRHDMTRQQQEAKEREEQRIVELTEKLRERELECEELKKKISELLRKANIFEAADDDEEHLLEKQAIEKLDAAIADMDLGEDDDDEDDDDEEDGDDNLDGDNDNVDDECAKKRNGNATACSIETNDTENDIAAAKADKEAFDTNSPTSNTDSKKHTNFTTRVPLALTSIFVESINGIEDEGKAMMESEIKLPKSKKAKMLATLNPNKKPASQVKRVKESTIMKWLNNSDLKKNEGSLDIFKAICNENEDDEDADADGDGNGSDSSEEDYDKQCDEGHRESSAEFKQKTNNFTSILKNVEQNLKQLEAEIENRTTTSRVDIEQLKQGHDNEDDDEKEAKLKKHNRGVYEFDESNDSGAPAEEEEEDACVRKRNGPNNSSTSANSNKVLSKNNKKYQLLKSSVNMLREAFNEIRDTVKEQTECSATANELSSPLHQQSPGNDTLITSNAFCSLTDTPESSRASCDDIVDLDTDCCSEVESLSRNSPVYSTNSTIKQHLQTNTKGHEIIVSNNLLEEQLKEYQEQVSKLNEKLHHTELEAQHTLEIMQAECDNVKEKMLDSVNVIEGLKEDKKSLGQVINELSEALNTCKEEEIIENDLADINVTDLEREEELITYKERLDEQQKENIELRKEIATLKLQSAGGGFGGKSTKSNVVLKRVLPYGFVVLAIVVYFVTTYF